MNPSKRRSEPSQFASSYHHLRGQDLASWQVIGLYMMIVMRLQLGGDSGSETPKVTP